LKEFVYYDKTLNCTQKSDSEKFCSLKNVFIFRLNTPLRRLSRIMSTFSGSRELNCSLVRTNKFIAAMFLLHYCFINTKLWPISFRKQSVKGRKITILINYELSNSGNYLKPNSSLVDKIKWILYCYLNITWLTLHTKHCWRINMSNRVKEQF
jgi:hypothetical protein